MKNKIRGAAVAIALALPVALATPAHAANVGGTFTCGNGVTTRMYSPSGYDYHEVNNRYAFWAAPSNYTTQVNWGATSGYWYLESNTNFNYQVFCR